MRRPLRSRPSTSQAAAVARVLVPLRLALVRLRAHSGRSVLAALGIAVAAAVLAMTAVASVAVRDRAVQRSLAALAPSDRALQVTWSGVPAQSELSLAQLDRAARRALRVAVASKAFRVAVFRQANWGGAYVSLGAVDGLARRVALRSGRLPRPCTAMRCELLQIGGSPVAPKLSFLHVVGRAVLRPGAPLRDYVGAAGHRRPPVLLADGVAGFVRLPLPDAAIVARSYGWIVALPPGSVHSWDLGAFQRRLDLAETRLEKATDLFTLAAPSDTLAAVAQTSRVAARRLLVVGGDAAVLLLGFAVLASTRLRRDHDALRRRLRRLGARGGQRGLVAAVEVAALAVAGTVVGWPAGAGAGAFLARRLGSPAWPAVSHSALTGGGIALGCGLAGVTAVVMLVSLLTPGLSVGGARVTAADVAAAGALGAILLALARGQADATALAAGGGTGALLLLLPALAILVLAVAAARLLAPALRLLERGARRGPVAARVALLSLARSPGQATLSVVFFVVAVSVVVFALTYRATLQTGQRQEADYAVPAQYVLTEDLTKLVSLQQAAPPARVARLGTATPVVRDAGFVSTGGGVDFTLLALPSAALARIGGWRADFSSQSRPALGRLIRPPGPIALRGLGLPVRARSLELPVTVRGDRVGVSLTVLDRRGDFSTILLGEHGRGRHVLRAPIPLEARGGRVVAVRVTLPAINAFVAGHKESGTALSVSDASQGGLSLGRLRAGGRVLAAWPGWIGVGGVRRAQTGVANLRYVVNRATDSVFRPRQPYEGEPLPVVVTPALAAAAGADGILPLHVEASTVLARVVGVARHVPSVDGNAVVADSTWWLAAANAAWPGSGAPTEWWLDRTRPGASAALRRPPFSALSVTSQTATYAALRTDPLARGTLDVLLVSAALGLGLAAVGVLLAVVGDLRDESGELFDLEAQGASPTDVRRHLLLRAASVFGTGAAGGLAAGVAVGALVVSVVTVTAGAVAPLPPLQRVTDWPLVLLALAVLAAAAGLASLVATRGAFEAVGRRRFSEGL
jgi:FtsX-like permease family